MPKCKVCNLFKKRLNSRVCWTCTNLKRDIFKRTYQVLKMNAKRRGKEFGITFEYFKEMCLNTGYTEGKGVLKDSLTIDRKKNELGYIEGNLRVITKSLNSIKGINPIDVQGIYYSTEQEPF